MVSINMLSLDLDSLSAISLIKSLRVQLCKLISDENNFHVIHNEVINLCENSFIPEKKKCSQTNFIKGLQLTSEWEKYNF